MSVRTRIIFAAALVIAAALAANFTFFFFRDNFATHYPIKVISQQAWRAGEIPWWNFYDGGGQPLAGNPNTLTFYPDNILYVLLPAHVAFCLHFLLHLVLGWFAMRELTESHFGPWVYVLSGIAMSLLAFYNMVTAFALIPYAWWATERGSWRHLGVAFGLMALAGEPVTIAGAALGCAILAWRRISVARIAAAIVVAFAIASPLLIAYSEIASETERGTFRYSARTVLAASFAPYRIVEMLIGPIRPPTGPQLFLSLFIGIIAIPALFQKSRYVAIALASLFLALGSFNPLVRLAVEHFSWLRLGRFPEKFALPLCVALVVLAAAYFRKTANPIAWFLITFLQLIVWAALTIPIDRFAPYDVAPQPGRRIAPAVMPGGQTPSRAEYRERARRLEPLFGAVAGVRYALDRSPDGMFSIRTRIATERFAFTHDPSYARILERPPAMIVRPSAAHITSYAEGPQSIEIGVDTPAPALLFVNQTYFRAWDAHGLQTLLIDPDRLGVMVPAGRRVVTLTFGRHRAAVVAAWIVSTLVLIAALLVDPIDRRAGEIERAADED